ncbi:MAG TPA: RHS repeat-associated core domain-containing protein, partial [Burkholderiaceae bacterium]|nr:RHS repeat-associated core domain-containing protein [Burkholderiaceae bacterium]
QAWFGDAEQLVWLHANHLGAVELATDAAGRSVWQGQYSAHGALLASQGTLAMNLRLPGQYFDAESGLHYNDHRYYDPQRGEYLSPDPLGTPDGPNPYSYVRGNPQRYVDPEGLLLLAFDGTGNTDVPEDLAKAHMTPSNVVWMRDLYDDGSAQYVTGVGTLHKDEVWGDIKVPDGDAGFNRTGTTRIDRMMVYFLQEMDKEKDDSKVIDIDITGFSRGASQARDFANQLTRLTRGGVFSYNLKVKDAAGEYHEFKGCQRVNFRFMGLFDTVLSTNSGRDYRLGIPPEFKYVAHATALNEYRASAYPKQWGETRLNLPDHAHWGAFPLESIGGNARTPTQTRVEMGFIGAHSDIGGGYRENSLSTVALNWMLGQAQLAGVKIKTERVPAMPTEDPVIHDQSSAILVGNPLLRARITVPGTVYGTNSYDVEDREVRGAASGRTQRTMGFGAALPGGDRSMVNADTHAFINYAARPNGEVVDPAALPEWIRNGNRTGTVDIKAYLSWLRSHGYAFAGKGEY